MRNLFRRTPPQRRYHDIYYAPPAQTSTLQPFLTRRWLLLGSVPLFAILIFFVLRPVLNAEAVTLYPRTCLGGWQNPQHAQGEIAGNAASQTGFSEDTAAYLPVDTVADLYCGGFVADIPPDTEPTELTLLIAWGTDTAVAAPPISAPNFDEASGAILDAPSGSAPTFELIEPAPIDTTDGETTPPPLPPSAPEPEANPTPEPEPTPETSPAEAEPAPVSFLKRFVPVARAQEVLPTEILEAIPMEGLGANVLDVLGGGEVNQQGESGSEENPSTDGMPGVLPDSLSVVLPGTAFIEVKYTFDGEMWYSLGTFDEAHITPTTFSIPVPPQTSWTNLSNFQVRVTSSPTIDGAPQVYLDGMELRVGYGEATAPRFFPDKDLYGLDEVIHITSSKPGSAVQLYWLDDPDTAPEASSVYAAIVGDDGTVALEARTLFPGRFALVNTVDKLHCAAMYLSQCLARGALGDVIITVALPEEVPLILAARIASSTASTTQPGGEVPDASLIPPGELPPPAPLQISDEQPQADAPPEPAPEVAPELPEPTPDPEAPTQAVES